MAIDPGKVLRLNLPQWQGGDRPNYRIGGRVLTAIAPEPQGPEETVTVPRAGENERPFNGGIVSRHALLEQLAAARSAIGRHTPEAIVTLGGDCHVDLAPIAYLSERYGDDLAVLWIDAHQDILRPEQNRYAHTHVLATLMGEGDPKFVAAVRRPVDPRRVLYVGLTETSSVETDFIRDHEITRFSPEDLAGSSERVLKWLRASGARKVAVHFDVDAALKDDSCREVARELEKRAVPFLIYSGYGEDQALLAEFRHALWIEKPVRPLNSSKPASSFWVATLKPKRINQSSLDLLILLPVLNVVVS